MGTSIGIFDDKSKRTLKSRLKNQVTIMTAELIAIYIACEYAVNYKYKNPVIFTDSLAGVKYLKKRIDEKNFNDLVIKICCQPLLKITVQWIPSHVGIRGNERADLLAREAFDSDEIFENKILLHDIINNIKETESRKFEEWYATASREKGAKFYALQTNITKKPWFYKLPIESRELRTMNRLLAGHDFSPYWLAKMNKIESGVCELCDVDNTSSHIILDCIKYSNERYKYGFDRYTSLPSLIDGFNLKTLKHIIKFLNEIKIEV